MKISHIMTKKIVKISMDESLQKMQDIFDKNQFHHLLVFEQEKLAGIISDRDILREISPVANQKYSSSQDKDTLNKKAHQVMTRTPITIEEHCDIKDAVSLLLNKNISCLPVTGKGGIVVGILTGKDIFKYFLEREEQLKKEYKAARRDLLDI